MLFTRRWLIKKKNKMSVEQRSNKIWVEQNLVEQNVAPPQKSRTFFSGQAKFIRFFSLSSVKT
jgi:hypothetical protein